MTVYVLTHAEAGLLGVYQSEDKAIQVMLDARYDSPDEAENDGYSLTPKEVR